MDIDDAAQPSLEYNLNLILNHIIGISFFI